MSHQSCPSDQRWGADWATGDTRCVSVYKWVGVFCNYTGCVRANQAGSRFIAVGLKFVRQAFKSLTDWNESLVSVFRVKGWGANISCLTSHIQTVNKYKGQLWGGYFDFYGGGRREELNPNSYAILCFPKKSIKVGARFPLCVWACSGSLCLDQV